jgi:hypothetical protein
MARKSLRAHLNQIRAWVRQGRTDAWIAHQLDVSASQLREFRSRHDLSREGDEGTGELDLRDEIEAEIEAELEAATEEDEEEEGAEPSGEVEEGEEGEERPRRRRRRRGRRGGRRRGGRSRSLEATFDHGEKDGVGLWLDPAVQGQRIYREHWAGHRRMRVTIDPERIVIEREDDGSERSAEDED